MTACPISLKKRRAAGRVAGMTAVEANESRADAAPGRSVMNIVQEERS